MRVFMLERGYDYEGSQVIGLYSDFDKVVEAFYNLISDCVNEDVNGVLGFCPYADFFLISAGTLDTDESVKVWNRIEAEDIEEQFHIAVNSVDGFNGFSREFIEEVIKNGERRSQ